MFQFLPDVFHFLLLPRLHQFHFLLGVIELDVRIHIQRDGNVAVSHQVLQRLGADPGKGHIGTVRMAADVWRDFWQLILVNRVVFFQGVAEIMLPMHGHRWIPVGVIKEEVPYAINDLLDFGRFPPFQNSRKAVMHGIRHGQHPGSGLGFRGNDISFSIHIPLQLPDYVNGAFFQVDIADGQPAKLRNPQPRMEQDKYDLVVFPVVFVVFQKVQENPHIFPGKGFPSHAVVNQDFSHFKVKGISPQDFIVHGHLERRAHHAADTVDRAASPS